MNYLNINKNDIANGNNICVSLFVSGCPHRCPGCFNPEGWDFEAGKSFTWETINEIKEAINANGIIRNLSILGGEPLAPKNRTCIAALISEIRKTFPDIEIYVWTGYIYEKLLEEEDSNLNIIFSEIDYLIDGPYEEKLHDVTLKWRGSSNQRIISMQS